MDQKLYEPDTPYAHGRLIAWSLLVAMPLICLLPRWIFHYQWDQHVLMEPQTLEGNVRISRFIEKIPEPRLQSQPQQDLQRFKAEQQQKLQTYGWQNRESGLVRIPIQKAMERYLQSSHQP